MDNGLLYGYVGVLTTGLHGTTFLFPFSLVG